MMALKVRVEGLADLERALRGLPKATGKTVLRRTLVSAADPILKAAVANAPELTGDLKIGLGSGSKLTARQKRAAGKAATFVQVAGDGKKSYRSGPSTGVEMHVGPATTARFRRAPDPAGLLNEFGTVNMPAQPFMRPAWDGNKQAALETIKTQLGDEITKAAARLAKKLAKGG